MRNIRRRSLLAAGLATALALVSGVVAGAPAAGATTPVQLTFPAPSGPHAVGVVKAHLTDKGRLEVKFTLEGRLDDPSFSLNENLATKIASGMAESLGVSLSGVVKGLGGVVKGLFGQ